MWFPRWALLVLAALVGGFLLGGAAGRDNSLFGPTVASWGQTVGTVGAIIGAIWATNRQIYAQAKLARTQRDDMVRAIAEAQKLAFDAYADVLSWTGQSQAAMAMLAVGRLNEDELEPLNRFIAMDIDRWPAPLLLTRSVAFVAAGKSLATYVRDWGVTEGKEQEYAAVTVLFEVDAFLAADTLFREGVEEVLRGSNHAAPRSESSAITQRSP